MSILARINRFFWLPSLSMFDLLAIGIISNLMVNFNLLWGLLYAVVIMVSVTMQNIFEKIER